VNEGNEEEEKKDWDPEVAATQSVHWPKINIIKNIEHK
jgi:hypothetical protein